MTKTKSNIRNKAAESFGKVINPGTGIREWNNPNGKNPGDVTDFWDVPVKGSNLKHYAMFNSDLLDKPILAGCPAGGIILDPFAGTGTTLLRAIQLGRNAIGIDGNADYCSIAHKRIEEEQNQLKLEI